MMTMNGRSRIPNALVVLCSLLPIGSAGCGAGGEADLGLNVDVGISPTPPVVGATRLLVSVSDSEGNPVVGAEVRVEGNMSHAGMAPVFGNAQEEGDGVYVVPGFRFTMAGDWILTVRVTLPDGRQGSYEHATDVLSMSDRGGTSS